MTNELTRKSKLLDFTHPDIETLIAKRSWQKLDEFNKIGAAYDYVKNEVLFGYNSSDDLKASEVLRDGYGQCNTKATLLMALLRALGIPCRLHGFTINQALQKGAIPTYIFWLAPKYIIHTWVEVYFEDSWIDLEGFILDEPYLQQIQDAFGQQKNEFCGYGVATKCLLKPQTEWKGKSTYIQKEGIHDDFGIFATPDVFYSLYGTNLKGIKRWLYRNVIRHLINRNVSRIRNSKETWLTDYPFYSKE